MEHPPTIPPGPPDTPKVGEPAPEAAAVGGSPAPASSAPESPADDEEATRDDGGAWAALLLGLVLALLVCVALVFVASRA